MSRLLAIMLIIFTAAACKDSQHAGDLQDNQTSLNDHLANANKIRTHNESIEIDSFASRHQFRVERTGTGLRYEIYHHGEGVNPLYHDKVKIAYRLFLLDGTLCYTVDTAKPAVFRLAEGQQTNGLEEGLMKMIPGDKARLIVPSHLAYGLTGDDNKIPPSSSVFYDVDLISISK